MNVKKIDSVTLKKDSVIFLFTEEQISGKEKMNIKNAKIENTIKDLKKKGDFKGNPGEASYFFMDKTLVLVMGLGKSKEVSGSKLRATVGRALLSPKISKHKNVEIVPYDRKDDTYRAVIEGSIIGTYRWKKYMTKKKDDKSIDKKNIDIFLPGCKNFKEIVTIAEGVNYARDLVNENADIMDSKGIEKEVRKIIKGQKSVSLKILKEKELVKNKMNLHLAVNKGSKKEPMLIIVKYSRGKGKYTALVGKGLTFDSGGLNLKPTGYLETMREDMGGSAAVIGALKNTLSLKPKKNILFVLGIAENAIGSNATKPGDVIKSYEGKTVEIANTDAEGRLVLADANAYVTKNYDVKTVINIATLTGAVVVALGYDHSAVMSTKQEIADHLITIGKETDEPVWQLPMYDELKEHVKSKYADIKNVGLPKGNAGTISAGEFLRQFARDKDWAHLDIAGTVFVEGDGRSYYGFGATGSGVRLLSNYVLRYC